MSTEAQTTASVFELVLAVAEGRSDFVTLVNRLQPYLHQLQPLTPEIALELSTALHELQEWLVSEDERLRLVNQYPVPALLVARSGQVVAQNYAGEQWSGLNNGDDVDRLGVAERQWQSLWQRLLADPEPSLLAVTHGPSSRLVMLASYQPSVEQVLLLALQQHWPAAADLALRELFALAPAESAVLAQLAAGLSAEQMAQRSTKSVGTIRQQIKQVLAKLGASSQIQAAAMASAAANALSAASLGPLADSQLSLATAWQQGELWRQGRRIGWRQFGDPAGRPVLLLHGPSFAAGEFAHDRDWAKAKGLAVYAIERPGYGRTDTLDDAADVVLEQVEDWLALMDDQRLSRVSLLSHECALIPALALAQRVPERVQGIVSVSASPPFVQLAQLQAMPEQQAVFILAAKQARWLARLMLKLLVLRLRRLGPGRWYQAVFAGVADDLAVTQRPELQAGVVAAYDFYTRQQGLGFDIDLQTMIQDWAPLVRDCPVPLLLLHGENNLSTDPALLRIFSELNAQTQVRTYPGAGLTLALAAPEWIYQTVSELARSE